MKSEMGRKRRNKLNSYDRSNPFLIKEQKSIQRAVYESYLLGGMDFFVFHFTYPFRILGQKGGISYAEMLELRYM